MFSTTFATKIGLACVASAALAGIGLGAATADASPATPAQTVAAHTSSPAPNCRGPVGIVGYEITGNAVRIHSYPSTSAPTVGLGWNHQQVQMLSEGTAPDGRGWTRLQDGRIRGWVIDTYVGVEVNSVC